MSRVLALGLLSQSPNEITSGIVHHVGVQEVSKLGCQSSFGNKPSGTFGHYLQEAPWFPAVR